MIYIVKLHDNGDEYGDEYWYKDGKLHREGDKPAFVGANGQRVWFKDGKRHREKGPAIIYANGDGGYYLQDIPYTKEEWKAKLNPEKKPTDKDVLISQLKDFIKQLEGN